MSNNKLKAKTLNNISTVQGDIDGVLSILLLVPKEELDTKKIALHLQKLSTIAGELKEDIIQILMQK